MSLSISTPLSNNSEGLILHINLRTYACTFPKHTRQRFKTAVRTETVKNSLNCGAFKEALTFDSQIFLAKNKVCCLGKGIWKANGDQTL